MDSFAISELIRFAVFTFCEKKKDLLWLSYFVNNWMLCCFGCKKTVEKNVAGLHGPLGHPARAVIANAIRGPAHYKISLILVFHF